MSESIKAAFESKLYYRSSGNFYEIDITKDVEINESPDMLDASTRGDGIKRSYPGQSDGKLTFNVLAIKGNTAYEYLKAAAIAKTPVELAWTEGDSIYASGTVYGRDWFYLTWKRGEPLNDMPTIDIEASPAIYRSGGSQVTRTYPTNNTTTSTTTTA